MKRYVILLRGVNVGGKNAVSMATLKTCLERLGLEDVSTYIASGNVLARSDKPAREIEAMIVKELPKRFALDREQIDVLALTHAQLKAVVKNKPKGFGERPDTYHSDVIFLMGGVTAATAMKTFDPREGVDTVWPGKGVIYSQRLSAERTKSRLNKIMSSPLYQSMTIRNWNTTTKLLALLDAMPINRSSS